MQKENNKFFEILHLISVLKLRFEKIFKESGVDPEQIYILAYLKSNGLLYVRDNRELKIIQRARIAKILNDVFGCGKNRCTVLVTELKEKGYIEDFDIKQREKNHLFSGGYRRVLGITSMGIDKIERFTDELNELYQELMDPTHNLLFLPQAEKRGMIANSLVGFLKFFNSFRR